MKKLWLLVPMFVAAFALGSIGGQKKAEAQVIGGDGGDILGCPGGGEPSCTQCLDSKTCVFACRGGFYCFFDPGLCGYQETCNFPTKRPPPRRLF